MKSNKNQKTAKAFINLNIAIDEEQKKLSDKMKNIELSHNRKIGLLKKIDFWLKLQQTGNIGQQMAWQNMIPELRNDIQKELNFCGRIYWG